MKDVRGFKVIIDKETKINEKGSKAHDNYELKFISDSRTMSRLAENKKTYEEY